MKQGEQEKVYASEREKSERKRHCASVREREREK